MDVIEFSGGGLATDPYTYPVELAAALADRLRSAKQELVTQWLNRISERVAISARRVFPSHALINHVPILVEGIAGYLKRPERDIDAKAPVVAKAMELGALRHEQGFDAYELLKEYEMLAEILFDFLAGCAAEMPDSAPRTDFLAIWQRLAQAIELIRQATVSHFLRLQSAQINERENRLRKFNRTVAHELKNKVHTIANAASALGEGWVSEAEREKFSRIITSSAASLTRAVENLETLSRSSTDSRHCRNVLLPEAATEAARELKEAATAKGVDVRIADDLPPIEVDAATVELCLMNYLSNGIKYADDSKAERWVEVAARVEGPDTENDREVVIRVFDNGIGVPPEKREQLFQEFFRAHEDTVTGVEGSGLGLSIVRETVESIGGRAWAEFPDDVPGSVFAFAIPARRVDDLVAGERVSGNPPSGD